MPSSKPRTSIYVTPEDKEGLAKAGLTPTQAMRRGYGMDAPDVALARLAASEVLAAISDELQDRIDRAVERALRKMQGGGH